MCCRWAKLPKMLCRFPALIFPPTTVSSSMQELYDVLAQREADQEAFCAVCGDGHSGVVLGPGTSPGWGVCHRPSMPFPTPVALALGSWRSRHTDPAPSCTPGVCSHARSWAVPIPLPPRFNLPSLPTSLLPPPCRGAQPDCVLRALRRGGAPAVLRHRRGARGRVAVRAVPGIRGAQAGAGCSRGAFEHLRLSTRGTLGWGGWWGMSAHAARCMVGGLG